VPYDAARVIASFDADVLVVSESCRMDDGRTMLDPLFDLGYRIETIDFMRLEARRDRNATRDAVPPRGLWQLAICSRFPVAAKRVVPIGRLRFDPAGARNALACTLDLGEQTIEVVGVHTSSRFYLGSSARHLIGLRRQLDATGTAPDVIAGDFNLWGPVSEPMFPGWRRAVVGRTYPAHRAHSQIDHILVRDRIEVLASEVLGATPSDHRPLRVRLRVPHPLT